MSNLTLRNGSGLDAPIGLTIANSFGSITVDNVIVHGHRATTSPYLGGVAITLDSSSHDIALRNSLAYDNQGAFFLGPTFPLASMLFTSLSLNPDRNWRATNNTIVESPDSSSEAMRLQSDGNFWLVNNVIRGGMRYIGSITGAGAATAPQVHQLFNNFSAASTLEGAVLAQDAFTGFDAPRLAADYDLLDGSPLFDAALGAPPGGVPDRDVYGRPRVFHDFLDIGAVEARRVVPEPGAASALAAIATLAAMRSAKRRLR